MKRTSFFSRLVRIAARSFGFSSTGPEVWRRLTPSSLAMMCDERRLAEPGRAEQQHVVHRLAAHPGRADEDLELLARLRLADVLGEALRPQRALDRLLVRRAGAPLTTRPPCRRCARRGPGAKSSVWMRHGPLSSAARRRDCRDNRRVQRSPRRLSPDLVAARRRAAARRARCRCWRARGAALQGRATRRGVRRLRRRHVAARAAVGRGDRGSPRTRMTRTPAHHRRRGAIGRRARAA